MMLSENSGLELTGTSFVILSSKISLEDICYHNLHLFLHYGLTSNYRDF